eukprot:GHVN01073421.1.p1 GENE.GHVN01073421.1~~GHVN01073421.1.p1  ORF type:complete len:664 (-),score=99.42 GHVN01073421.1:85-2076(-)
MVDVNLYSMTITGGEQLFIDIPFWAVSRITMLSGSMVRVDVDAAAACKLASDWTGQLISVIAELDLARFSVVIGCKGVATKLIQLAADWDWVDLCGVDEVEECVSGSKSDKCSYATTRDFQEQKNYSHVDEDESMIAAIDQHCSIATTKEMSASASVNGEPAPQTGPLVAKKRVSFASTRIEKVDQVGVELGTQLGKFVGDKPISPKPDTNPDEERPDQARPDAPIEAPVNGEGEGRWEGMMDVKDGERDKSPRSLEICDKENLSRELHSESVEASAQERETNESSQSFENLGRELNASIGEQCSNPSLKRRRRKRTSSVLQSPIDIPEAPGQSGLRQEADTQEVSNHAVVPRPDSHPTQDCLVYNQSPVGCDAQDETETLKVGEIPTKPKRLKRQSRRPSTKQGYPSHTAHRSEQLSSSCEHSSSPANRIESLSPTPPDPISTYNLDVEIVEDTIETVDVKKLCSNTSTPSIGDVTLGDVDAVARRVTETHGEGGPQDLDLWPPPSVYACPPQLKKQLDAIVTLVRSNTSLNDSPFTKVLLDLRTRIGKMIARMQHDRAEVAKQFQSDMAACSKIIADSKSTITQVDELAHDAFDQMEDVKSVPLPKLKNNHDEIQAKISMQSRRLESYLPKKRGSAGRGDMMEKFKEFVGRMEEMDGETSA